MIPYLALGLFLAGLVGFALSIPALARLRHDRRRGRLVSVDVRSTGPPLYAPSVGLVGRPDEVRRLPDGRAVPIELKSRRSPRRGPPPSHIRQLQAYCYLLEETTGRSPPYGVLRYGDGQEWEIPWGADGRAAVVVGLSEIRRRYQGEATPSAGKCRRCSWYEVCDARATGPD